MFAEITIVDQFDREIEQLLAGVAKRFVAVPGAQLSTFAHPAARQPEVLMIDLRGGRRFPPALTDLKAHHATTPVIILASHADPALMMEAMRAGITEFVVEPMTAPDLEAAVSRVVSRTKPAASTGEVFAFVGARGGVGTSTTVVNVATALSHLRRGKVLVIDLRLAHGDDAVLLGAESKFSVLDALENTNRLDETFLRGLVVTTKAGPELLPSSDRALVGAAASQDFRSVIEVAARVYRYVVIDVPRSDAAALDALDLASRIVVIANQELTAVRNASRIASTLRQRYGKDRVQVVVSRFDKDAEISTGDLERVVGGGVGHLIPSDYRRALQALNAGRPLAVENHSKLAAAYCELARDLAGVQRSAPGVKQKASPEPGGLFSMFTPRRQKT